MKDEDISICIESNPALSRIVGIADLVREIASALSYADGEAVAEIANQIFTRKVKYVGDSMFTQEATPFRPPESNESSVKSEQPSVESIQSLTKEIERLEKIKYEFGGPKYMDHCQKIRDLYFERRRLIEKLHGLPFSGI